MLKARAPNGVDKTQIILLAEVVVKGKPIVVIRYSVYTSVDATSDLLAKWKDTVAALAAANK